MCHNVDKRHAVLLHTYHTPYHSLSWIGLGSIVTLGSVVVSVCMLDFMIASPEIFSFRFTNPVRSHMKAVYIQAYAICTPLCRITPRRSRIYAELLMQKCMSMSSPSIVIIL
jgi:hypothetical protein